MIKVERSNLRRKGNELQTQTFEEPEQTEDLKQNNNHDQTIDKNAPKN